MTIYDSEILKEFMTRDFLEDLGADMENKYYDELVGVLWLVFHKLNDGGYSSSNGKYGLKIEADSND